MSVAYLRLSQTSLVHSLHCSFFSAHKFFQFAVFLLLFFVGKMLRVETGNEATSDFISQP